MTGSGFQADEVVRVEIFDGPGLQKYEGPYIMGDFNADDQGGFKSDPLTIPSEICCAGGQIVIRSTGKTSKDVAHQDFKLT